METKKRSSNLDFIRVVSMTMVIAVHTYPKPLASNELVQTILSMVLFSCNSSFFLLSGLLNLKKTCEDKGGYKKYYVKKFINIIVHYFVIMVLCQDLVQVKMRFSPF